MKQQKGNSLTIMMVLMGLMIIVFILVSGIVIGNMNAIVHGVKTDMYLINKSAIIAVNKNKGKYDSFSYNEKEYLEYFKSMLQKNYHLDEKLENPNGLVQKVSINEYKIYTKNQKDSVTKKRAEGTIIHTVITIKIKPLILSKPLEKYFTFQIHEDVYMEREKIK